MVKIVLINDLAAITEPADPRLPPFDNGQCRQHRCDARALVVRDGKITARGSLWWSESPALDGRRAGVVGHFAAADQSAAAELLDAACAELAARGCEIAIGPMDGNTWRRYRLLTERGAGPPFFMEPDNPDEWPLWFAAAHFSPLANYFSALNEDLSVEDPRIPRTLARLSGEGVRIRALRMESFAEELRRIHAMSCVSFRDNFLYTPIAEAEFLAQYEPVRAFIRPELVLFAECGDEPVGFMFGVPDIAQAGRGVPVDTVILKTVAVLPHRRFSGLGNVLVSECQQAARKLGFRRAIHALMHESNNSLNLSRHYAKAFRRYTLYSRLLNPNGQTPRT